MPSRPTPSNKLESFHQTHLVVETGQRGGPPISRSFSPTPKSNPLVLRRPARQGRMAPKERTVVKGGVKEEVNYPPYEQQSEYIRQKLIEMELYPDDGVGKYTRSIPFKGSKESFLKKTGRSGFDVFEYRFTAPNVRGEEKRWWVMWDYYNGLVRVHDFFECCRPGKTEPGNAVREKVNPGLSSVCHNITGGNLHAQGYWIPYDAAKALAAKFCYRIRYALTIIFGGSFPAQCLPETHPDFGKYQIDPRIIEGCRQRSVDQFPIKKRRSDLPHLSLPAPAYPPEASAPPPGLLVREGTSHPPRSTQAQEVSRIREVTSEQNRYYDPVRGTWTDGDSSQYRHSRSTTPQTEVARQDMGSPTNTRRKAERTEAMANRISLPLVTTFYPPGTARRGRPPPSPPHTEVSGKSRTAQNTRPPAGVGNDVSQRGRSSSPAQRARRRDSESPPSRRVLSRRQNMACRSPARLGAGSTSRRQFGGRESIGGQAPDSGNNTAFKHPPTRSRFRGGETARVPSPPPGEETPISSNRPPMKFVLGTFDHPRRSCRSDSYLGPASTSSRAQMERILANEEKSRDQDLAMEAARNLLRLQADSE